MPKINDIIVQSDGSKLHVKYIMHELATKVPRIRGIGGRVNRATRTGGVSAHADGRAMDIYLNAKEDIELRLANKLCEFFQIHSIPLKIKYYIWNGCDWSPTLIYRGKCHTYSGNNDARGPHKDHIHVEFENTDLTTKPISIIPDVIIPLHRFMETRDWNAPVEGWGSWNASDPSLKQTVVI
jgi:hypothetical protein